MTPPESVSAGPEAKPPPDRPRATRTPPGDCWNTIGVRGDRSCPELRKVVQCQNCPVFAAAGRRFLDAPPPPGYPEEWAERLAAPAEEPPADLVSVLIFRLADEWLALPVHVLVEVTTPRPVRRVPYRGGLLAGLVNIRGELYLCAHLTRLLGISQRGEGRGARGEPETRPPPARGVARVDPSSLAPRPSPLTPPPEARLLVVRRGSDRWVLPADAVTTVARVPRGAVAPPPATVARAVAHLSRGVFPWDGRLVGLLDDARLFEALGAKLR